MKRIFVTSTGTDIGKTLITSSLCFQFTNKKMAFKVSKPIISGWKEDASDAHEILRSMNVNPIIENINLINLYRFKPALSVEIAAKIENIEIDFERLTEFSYSLDQNTIIEGAGGIMSPINNNKTNLDLIKSTNSDILLVIGCYLGSISHALTALEVAKYNKINVKKIVINQYSPSNDQIDMRFIHQSLRSFTNIDIIEVPFINSTEKKWLYVPNILNNYDI